MTTQMIPASHELYEAATQYVAIMVALSRGVARHYTGALEAERTETHRRIEALLVQHHIEFYDKQDVADIACELAQYAERQGV